MTYDRKSIVLSSSLRGDVFNLSLIRKVYSLDDDIEKVSARVNVVYGTNRFESLCDGDSQFLTIVNLIPKTVMQLEFLPASLTASPSLNDVFRTYTLTSEYKDSKKSLGLIIGGCEDEVIIEFLHEAHYWYFRRVFEMYLSKRNEVLNIIDEKSPSIEEQVEDSSLETNVDKNLYTVVYEKEESEGEDAGDNEVENDDFDQEFFNSTKKTFFNPLLHEETKTEKLAVNTDSLNTWLKFVYIFQVQEQQQQQNSSKKKNKKKDKKNQKSSVVVTTVERLTNLYLYMKSKKILKKFRKYMMGLEVDGESSSFRVLLEVIENYEFDPLTLDEQISLEFMKEMLSDSHIRERLKKNLRIVSLHDPSSLNFYRVMRKRILYEFGEEALLLLSTTSSSTTTTTTITTSTTTTTFDSIISAPIKSFTASDFERVEDELIREKMWMWNPMALNDTILSLLFFHEESQDLINNVLLKQFHEDEEKRSTINNKSSEEEEELSMMRDDPNILFHLLSNFNRRKNVRLEEICFEMYVRVYHRDLYFEFRDLYHKTLPVEEQYFDAWESNESCQDQIIELELQLDDFEEEEEEEEESEKNRKYLESEIEILRVQMDRFEKIIKLTKTKLKPLDEEMSKCQSKMQKLLTKFMLSERRMVWVHDFLLKEIEDLSYGKEEQFRVSLVLSLLQQNTTLVGNYACGIKPEPIQTYLTISKYVRLHFFPDVSLVMLSSSMMMMMNSNNKMHRHSRELDYEEIVSVDLFSPLILTTSLKLLDLVSNLAKRIVSVNVNSFHSANNHKKKKKKNKLLSFQRKGNKFSFPLDTSFEFARNIFQKYLHCCDPYPEVRAYIDLLTKEAAAGKNVHPMKMTRARKFRIDLEMFNKFLVVFEEYFGRVKQSSRLEYMVMIFSEHEHLDRVYKKLLDLDEQFEINYPGAYQLLSAFDNSFWMAREKERDFRLFGGGTCTYTASSLDENEKLTAYERRKKCPFLKNKSSRTSKSQGGHGNFREGRHGKGLDEEGPDNPIIMKSASKGGDLSEKHTKEMNLALIELLQTQEFYVMNLEMFNDKFLLPMERSIQQQQLEEEEETEEKEGEDGEKELEEKKEEEKKDNFQIFKIENRELVEELKKIRSVIEIENLFLSSLKSVIDPNAEENLSKMNDILEKILLHSYALKGYASYMCAYPLICDNLNKEENSNESFRAFLQSVESGLRGQKGVRVYTSRSFLLQPIQRIPRIRMLIERVLKRVGEDYQEHRMLMKAYEKIETMATYSNSKMKEMKNLQKLREIEDWVFGGSNSNKKFDLVVPGVRIFKDETIKVRKLRNVRRQTVSEKRQTLTLKSGFTRSRTKSNAKRMEKNKKVVRMNRVLILTHVVVVFYKGMKKKTHIIELEKAVVMKERIQDDAVAKYGLVVKSMTVGFSFCFDKVELRDEYARIISHIIGNSKMIL